MYTSKSPCSWLVGLGKSSQFLSNFAFNTLIFTRVDRFFFKSAVKMVDQADPVEHESWSYQLSFSENIVVNLFKAVNKHVPWHKLPSLIGTFNLLAFRYELRVKNLYDG